MTASRLPEREPDPELIKKFYSQRKKLGGRFQFPPRHNFDIYKQECVEGCQLCEMETKTTQLEFPIPPVPGCEYTGNFAQVFRNGYPKGSILHRRMSNENYPKRKHDVDGNQDDLQFGKRSRSNEPHMNISNKSLENVKLGAERKTITFFKPSRPYWLLDAERQTYTTKEKYLSSKILEYCRKQAPRRNSKSIENGRTKGYIMRLIESYIKLNLNYDWDSKREAALEFLEKRELYYRQKSGFEHFAELFSIIKTNFNWVLLQDVTVLRLEINRSCYDPLEQSWFSIVFQGGK